jgi:hypothetical protein
MEPGGKHADETCSVFLVLFFFHTLIRGCSAPKRKPVSRILGKADMNQA